MQYKVWITLLALGVFSLAQAQTVVRLSTPVSQTATSETFGNEMDTALPQVSLSELLANAQQHLGKSVKVTARIAKVCQEKGCFFIAQQEDAVLRVAFKDYGFFIPTDSSGKTVTMAAKLVEKERSNEQAAHFNRDLGEDTPTLKAGTVYELVANSIVIPTAPVKPQAGGKS